MVEGSFRGQTGLSLKRELAKISKELMAKGCRLIVILSDADKGDWREVLKQESAKVPDDARDFTVYAIADRNIECWLCADPHYIAKVTGRNASDFSVEDPKGAFESAMGISRDKKEPQIAKLVSEAPFAILKTWLGNRSFECFYDELWRFSGSADCGMENLREADGQ